MFCSLLASLLLMGINLWFLLLFPLVPCVLLVMVGGVWLLLRYFPLSLLFSILIIISIGIVFFVFMLLGVHWVFWICSSYLFLYQILKTFWLMFLKFFSLLLLSSESPITCILDLPCIINNYDSIPFLFPSLFFLSGLQWVIPTDLPWSLWIFPSIVFNML